MVDDKDATFEFHGAPPLTAVGSPRTVAAYHLDPKTGDIDYAPDRGISGTRTAHSPSQRSMVKRPLPGAATALRTG